MNVAATLAFSALVIYGAVATVLIWAHRQRLARPRLRLYFTAFWLVLALVELLVYRGASLVSRHANALLDLAVVALSITAQFGPAWAEWRKQPTRADRGHIHRAQGTR